MKKPDDEKGWPPGRPGTAKSQPCQEDHPTRSIIVGDGRGSCQPDSMPIIGKAWWDEFGAVVEGKVAAYTASLIANQRLRAKARDAELRLSEISVYGQPLPLNGNVGAYFREDLKNVLLGLDLTIQKLSVENEILSNALSREGDANG